jgi:hypothetical protein
MKCSKRLIAVVSVLFAVPISFGIGTLNARGAKPASVTLSLSLEQE